MGHDAPPSAASSSGPLLLAVVRAVSAVSRLSLGPLLPLLSKDLQVDVIAKGQLLSSFSTGYLLTQVLGGWVADRLGARLVVLSALLATSALVATAPRLALSSGAEGLALVYLVLGLVNGPLFPSCSVMLRDVPAKSRSQAMAIVDAGGTLGGCIATAACPLIASRLGWPMLFDLLAIVAAGVALLWWATAVDPAPLACEDAAASPIAGGKPLKQGQTTSSPVSVRGALRLFLYAAPWALFWSHSVFNYSNYFLNAWLPTMFVERFPGIDAAAAGAFLLWPELAGIGSRFFSATCADRLLALGRVRLQPLRRISTTAAFLLQGFFLVLASRQRAPLPCAGLLVLAAASSGVHACGFKANYLELTKLHSGVLTGVGNTVASVASAAGPIVTSAVLAWVPGSWEALFSLLCALNVSGALVAASFLSVECLDARVAKEGGVGEETELVVDEALPKTSRRRSGCAWPRRR